MERPLVVERVRTFSHIGIWIVFICVGIWIMWSALNKRTESNEYTKGASHTENSSEISVHEYPLSFGCARFDLRGNDKKVKKVKEK